MLFLNEQNLIFPTIIQLSQLTKRNPLNLNIKQMKLGINNMAMMTKESQYLFIKERLDFYNLSMDFTLQAMPLLMSLIGRIQSLSQVSSNLVKGGNSNQNLTKSKTIDPFSHYHIEPALKKQLSRSVHANNILHLELITQKQQIQSLKHCIDKLTLQRAESSQKDQVKHILRMCREKQEQLVQELQVVKFKYNELVDFVMGQDDLQKKYIKKLLNYKKYESADSRERGQLRENEQHAQQANSKPNKANNNNKSTQQLNSRITFKAGSSRKQSRQRINKTTDSKENSRPQGFEYELKAPSKKQNLRNESRQDRLQQKLLNRQKQIERLQSVMRHQGPNITKVVIDYNYEMQQGQYKKLQERIQYLQQENNTLKQELNRSKHKGGRYQALIQEVGKSHIIISKLKKECDIIKRTNKQKEFDMSVEKKEMERSVVKAEEVKEELRGEKVNDEQVIRELKRKIEFYERELGVGKNGGEKGKGKGNKVEGEKDIGMKGVKKVSRKGSKSGIKGQKSTTSQMMVQLQQKKFEQKTKYPIIMKQIGIKRNMVKKQAKNSQQQQQRQKYQDQIQISQKEGGRVIVGVNGGSGNRHKEIQEKIKVVRLKEQKKERKRKDERKKQVKKLGISEIIEEDGEDQLQGKGQQNEKLQKKRDDLKEVRGGNQGVEGQEQREQQQKKRQKREQSQQQKPQQQKQQQEQELEQCHQQQERNQTFLEQYQQIINQLSSRVLQLTQQLGSKNRTIKGLQEIVNRLINTRKREGNGDKVLDRRKGQERGNNDDDQQKQDKQMRMEQLQKQIKVLKGMLRQSECDRYGLSREVMLMSEQLHTLHHNPNNKNHPYINPIHQSPSQQQIIQSLNQLIQQKDKKITQMREQNITIQDQLLKALDRIRRLNDKIDMIRGKDGGV